MDGGIVTLPPALIASIPRRRRVVPVASFSFGAPGASFARTGGARYFDAQGVVQMAATGILRDSHFIASRRAILLEPQRTNLCIRSEDFSAWADINTCTVTTDATAAFVDVSFNGSAWVLTGYGTL